MKTLTAIKHIAQGWWLWFTSDLKAQVLEEKRKPICSPCHLRNKWLNVCNDCGCFLPAKRRVEDEQCPQNKW